MASDGSNHENTPNASITTMSVSPSLPNTCLVSEYCLNLVAKDVGGRTFTTGFEV